MRAARAHGVSCRDALEGDSAESAAGEAASAPVAGALANAVFDATGVRLRTVPFTAARVKAALGKA